MSKKHTRESVAASHLVALLNLLGAARQYGEALQDGNKPGYYRYDEMVKHLSEAAFRYARSVRP